MEMIRGRSLAQVRRYDWFKALVALGLFLMAYFVCGKWDVKNAVPTVAPSAVPAVATSAATSTATSTVTATPAVPAPVVATAAVQTDPQNSVKVGNAPATVKLYFDTAKTDVQSDAKQQLAVLIAYGNASPNAKIQLSGFHDKRGNAAANAELAKNRAKAVRELLKAGGLAEDRIIMVPPTELVGAADDKEARRVDVSVAQ